MVKFIIIKTDSRFKFRSITTDEDIYADTLFFLCGRKINLEPRIMRKIEIQRIKGHIRFYEKYGIVGTTYRRSDKTEWICSTIVRNQNNESKSILVNINNMQMITLHDLSEFEIL